jgi:hypothetical protein
MNTQEDTGRSHGLSTDAGHDNQEAAVQELRRALASIRFGSVLIKIHEGQVVGIETSTKLRLGGSRS